MKKIAVFGTGYVGLVTGACFANAGHNVICVDIDKDKVDMLRNGGCPIIEKDLPSRIENGVENGNLSFTTDAASAIEKCSVIFIAVGTPTKKGGKEADLSAVFEVANTIRKYAKEAKIVVQKSTVPVGTGDKVDEILNPKKAIPGIKHVVVSNPEFLKEGKAVEDFESPDRVVIGTDDMDVRDVMRHLYAPFMRRGDRIIEMSRPSAELTKVIANTMLAMRISAMNAITQLTEEFGADISEIREGIGSDTRIGSAFLYPGGATFGGSCFPKDVRALIATMEERGIDAGIFQEVMKINIDQRARFIGKIINYFKGNLSGKKVTIWGLSFKPGTDDIREAASFDVVKAILAAKGRVVLYDQYAAQRFKSEFGDVEGIEYCENQHDALEGSDALVILTDAKSFRILDLERICASMKSPIVFDGKNLYDPKMMAKAGIHYVCMGKSFVEPEIKK